MGIDLSLTNTGIVVLLEDGRVFRHETIYRPLSRRKKSDPPVTETQRIERLLQIANEIVGLIKTFNIKHVGIEGYAFDARWQAHQIGEVAGVVKTQIWLACKMIPYIVAPQSGRKHVLGTGKPTKKQIVEVVRDGFGVDVANDHEADAFVVARFLFDTLVAEQKQEAFHGGRSRKSGTGDR